MDPFTARTIKLSVNQMQDAMGFTTSVRAAHASYMLLEGSRDPQIPRDEKGRPRLPGVERAFKDEDERAYGRSD